MKSIISAALCCLVAVGSVFGLPLDEQTSQECIMVLCIAERSTIRLECYSPEQLFDAPVAYLTKKERDKHCFLQIDMNDQGLGILGAQWDRIDLSSIVIQTGRKAAPVFYQFNALSLFDMSCLCQEDAKVICFDAVIESAPIDTNTPTTEWISSARVVGMDEEQVPMLLFDRKIKSVCGMFMPAPLFEQPLRCGGKIKKQEALERGLIVRADDTQNDDVASLCEQDCRTAQASSASAPEGEAAVVFVPSYEREPASWFTYIQDSTIAALVFMKYAAATTWNATVGYIFGQ